MDVPGALSSTPSATERLEVGVASREDPTLAGRTGELKRLRERLVDAASGERQSVTVFGDAGMGKTALCRVVAGEAEKAGFRVAWGHCWEDVATPPFWPWTQILEESAGDFPEDSSLRKSADDALAQLSTSSPADVSEPARGPAVRFALFGIVSSYLRRASSERPHLLILEDLHAADESSLLLLEYVITRVRRGQLMIVGTYAPRDLERRPPFARVMSRIARESDRVAVPPIDAEAVGQIFTGIVGEEPSDALLDAVVRLSASESSTTKTQMGPGGKVRHGLQPRGPTKSFTSTVRTLRNSHCRELRRSRAVLQPVALCVPRTTTHSYTRWRWHETQQSRVTPLRSSI